MVPTSGNPTEVLAGRFVAWRTIVSSLIQYLNEVVSIEDEIVRQQTRLANSVTFTLFDQPSSSKDRRSNTSSNNPHGSTGVSHQKDGQDVYQTNFFLPQGNGSVQDLPQIFRNYHATSAALAQRASRDLGKTVIPRLEDLRRELLVKIKEIKGLSSDFKNSVQKELAQTKVDLQHYIKSVDDAKFNPQNVQPKNDPYLTKIALDRQIKRQIVEENYLHEAYTNLQNSGKELEKVVVIEVQNALTVYAKLQGEQAQNVFDRLISNLDYGFLTKPPSFEWDQFVAKDKNFIDENLPKRDYKSVQYDKNNDPLSYEVRASFLERRSKFLKSYSRGFYVLTPTFFHEFKTADRKKDLIPVMSLSLDEIELEEHSKQDSSQFKFVLKKVGRLSSHKFIFRAESYDTMMAWYNDIKSLKSQSSPTSRGLYAAKNHTAKISRVSSNATSRVMRNSMANDSNNEVNTILTAPNNNQNLPSQDDTFRSPSLMNSDAIYVKQIGAESTPQGQRQYVPSQNNGQQQPTPQQYQRYSLQFSPQQQQQNNLSPQQYRVPQNTAPYPSQPMLQQYMEYQPIPSKSQQQERNVPHVYVESATPVATTKGGNQRPSMDSYRNGEADGTSLSEDTMKTPAKETQELDDGFEPRSVNGQNGKMLQYQ
ncbi:Regulator of the glycerol channel 1 [Cyberlindnera fabianii]|nr:Regulator of the glycerol channel 1 [Cyberlindnera fabianii]